MAAAAKPVVREQRDIEWLVTWALRDQGLGWGAPGDRPAPLGFADYGTVIDDDDIGSHPSINLLTDDDAMVIKRTIDELPREAAALVVQYGRAGLRPDWAEEGEGTWEQARDARGRLRWKWANPSARTGAKKPLMVFVGLAPEVVEYERSTYALWWQGLADLVAPLNLRMQGHAAIGPEAPRMPWLQGKRTVHGLGEGADRTRRPVRGEMVESVRAQAQAPVRSVASDWSVENSVLHKKESQQKSAPHGRR
jgi:hypothetical protein